MDANSQEQANNVWFGCDISSETFWASMRLEADPARESSDLRKMKKKVFDRTEEGAAKFLEWVDKSLRQGERACVIMEATGRYSLELAYWLLQLRPKLHIAIVNPARIKKYGESLGVATKNDPVDARVTSCFGAARRPAAYTPTQGVRANVQMLSRTRQALVEMAQAHQLHSKNLSMLGTDPQIQSEVARKHAFLALRLQEAIQELEEMVEQQIAADPQLKEDIELADTIPGIGKVISAGLISDLGNMSRFRTGRQATAFVGLGVKENESGKTKKKPRLSKQGPSRSRRFLYLAAMAATRTDSALSAFYHGLVSRGKKKLTAMGALMRKILTILRAILVAKVPYDDAKVCRHLAPATAAKA